MAGPHICQNPCWNSLPAGENELTRAIPGAFINDSDIPSYTPIVSRTATLTPPPPLAPTKLVAKYTNADL